MSAATATSHHPDLGPRPGMHPHQPAMHPQQPHSLHPHQQAMQPPQSHALHPQFQPHPQHPGQQQNAAAPQQQWAPLSFAWARSLENFVDTKSTGAPPAGRRPASSGGHPSRSTGAAAPGAAGGQSLQKDEDGSNVPAGADSTGLESKVLAHLRRLMDPAGTAQRQNPAQQHAQPSLSARTADIPVFFKKKPDSESLSARAHLCAKYKFLQKQKKGLLDQQELEVIWMCLREHRTTPDDESGAERINYDDFTQAAAACAERVGPKSRRFFTAATFLTFEADDSGRIAILPFYLYIMRWVSITQTRIDMCLLDRDNDGFLSQEEMEAYIRGLVPSLKLLKDMDEEFLPLYCKIATRKFLFFCDPQRRGKLLIREVLLSPVLSELMELRQEPEGEEQQAALQENWFALLPARRIYEMFVALDVDQSGGLSKQELRAFNDDNLTDIFIERVFDLHVRRMRPKGGSSSMGLEGGRPGEMDLGSFLDLVLALDNKHTPEGLAYIFKCLDLNERGYLTTADVYTLFKSVHKRWMEGGNYELMIEDVKDEIWDMVKPQDTLRITLEDLVECKQGDTVCSMLIDIGGFWAHDNRENLAAQQDPTDQM